MSKAKRQHFSRLNRPARGAIKCMLANCLAILGLFALPQPAYALIDTPAAHDARATIRQLWKQYGSRPEWAEWSRQLNLPDVEYELRAGESADTTVIAATAERLQAGGVPQFGEPLFQQLTAALQALTLELAPLPPDLWADVCRQHAANYVPVTEQEIVDARATLSQCLDEFQRRYPAIVQQQDPWRAMLFWPETQALLTSMPEAATLDRLEMRWHNAPSTWNADELFEAAVAVCRAVQLLRAQQVAETSEQHAAAWNQLADLLAAAAPTVGTPTSASTADIAAAIHGRERLAQASPLTAAVRRELSRPNIILQAKTPWVEAQLSQPINEPYQVNEVFAGTRSFGNGRLVGKMSGRILPSNAIGRLLLKIEGTSTARASGSSEGVSVVSRSVTRIAGEKPFTLDARGMVALRGTVEANTNLVFESINAPGRSRQQSIATSETQARRPRAEAESAAYARRTILERLNAEGDEVARQFNGPYQNDFRDRRIYADRPVPEVRVRATPELVRWECRLTGPLTFAARSAPPEFNAATEVVAILSASGLEEELLVAFGSRRMTGPQLFEAMGAALGNAPPAEGSGQDFSVTFEPTPCQIELVEGTLRARLFIANFESGDVSYPAITVEAEYRPESRNGMIVFVRQGNLRVSPRGDGETGISGRQQTLKLAVQRKLGRVLAAELAWGGTPLADKKSALQLVQAQIGDGWLQLGLTPMALPAETMAEAP